MEDWRPADSHRETHLQRHSSLFQKTCSHPVAEEDLHRLLDGIEKLKLQHSESLRTIRSEKEELNRRCNELHEHLEELSLELEAQVCCNIQLN